MSGNVRLRWVNPTQRTDNQPATVADIKEIHIDTKLAALPASAYTRIATIGSQAGIAEATRLFPNSPGGTWDFRVGGIDQADQPFDSFAEVQIQIPVAPLRGVSNLTAELE